MRTKMLTTALACAFTVAPLGAQRAGGHDPLHEMDWGRTTFVLSEVLEFAPQDDARPVRYDLIGWTGGPIHRLWLKADGAMVTRGQGSHGEYKALYGRMVSPFWDAQFGLRADLQSVAGRTESLVGALVGLHGVAPGWFELESALFVTTEGKVKADLTGSYDLYLSQRLVLQPRAEASVAVQDIPEFGVGGGLTNGSVALRLRYELRREFSPYIGFLWKRSFGRTAEFARSAGERSGEALFVVGVRLWR